jgi:hypothetical protein
MNRPEELLNELKINRSSPKTDMKRRWPWVVGALVILIAAFLLLRGGKALEVETVNPRSAAESGTA